MKSKLCILFSFSFYFLSPVVLFAAEPNAPTVKMLHIFIRADMNEVFFENICVFERKLPQGPWEVNIGVPEGAFAFSFDEPNETRLNVSSTNICKRMASDSLIDSAGFSFALPNQDGSCQTQILTVYKVDSMIVHISGVATELASNILKSDEFRRLHSRFSHVYTANNLPAGTKVEINLSRLPRKDCQLWKVTCIAGLALITIAALLTLCRKGKSIKKE